MTLTVEHDQWNMNVKFENIYKKKPLKYAKTIMHEESISHKKRRKRGHML